MRKARWGSRSEISKATFAFIVGPVSIKAPSWWFVIELIRLAGPHMAPVVTKSEGIMLLKLFGTEMDCANVCIFRAVYRFSTMTPRAKKLWSV